MVLVHVAKFEGSSASLLVIKSSVAKTSHRANNGDGDDPQIEDRQVSSRILNFLSFHNLNEING